MPLKQNLTKYDMLAYAIRNAASKNLDYLQRIKTGCATAEEQELFWKAVVIASFSSGHSWQTHKCVTSDTSRISGAAIRRELEEVLAGKWKHVSSADIHEVINSKIDDNVAALWAFYHLSGEGHQRHIKAAWSKLKSEFSGECDVESIREYR